MRLKPLLISLLFLLLIFSLLTSEEVSDVGHDQSLSCYNRSLWLHKAYQIRSNIKDSLVAAMDSGYCGYEIDIIWDDQLGFYISHDSLPASTEKTLLVDVIDTINSGEKIIWLDWKNITFANIFKGKEFLENHFSKYSKDGRSLFVESSKVYALSFFSFLSPSWIKPLYWIDFRDVRKTLYDYLRNFKNLPFLCFSDYVSSNQMAVPSFKGCPFFEKPKVFLFTINDSLEASKAFELGADVILTDFLKSTP